MVWWKRGFLIVLLVLVGLIGFRLGRAVPARPIATAASRTVEPTESGMDGQPAAPGEIAGAPQSEPAKTPLIGALKSLVESSPVFDEADATGSLVDSLATADDLLSKAKLQNRQALARLNRRPPVAGTRSIVLVSVRGLLPSDVASDDASSNLTAMCAEGIRFTNSHAASPDPEMAWRGLMHGLGSGRAKETGRRGTSLAEVLWRASYVTAFCGIWREPDRLPIDSGFEHWFGVRGSHQASIPSMLEFRSDRAAVKVDAHSAADLIDATFADGRQWLKTADRSPLFLHLSWALPESDAERASALEAVSRAMRALLDDSASGRRFTIILTGDLAAPDGERPLSEEALRVPLVVWSGTGPGSIDEPVWTCDLLPTVAEWARAPSAVNHDGRSWNPLLAGKDWPERLLYWKTTSNPPWQAALLGDWKGIAAPGSAIRLYNLELDPDEKIDVARHHPEIVRQLVKEPPKATEEAASEL
ncbi:MAG: hypothetical protein KF777_00105 [Planctomycetaceae bacterium]|nr:hypothetical protein [Planctomycetaceae bacterium]